MGLNALILRVRTIQSTTAIAVITSAANKSPILRPSRIATMSDNAQESEEAAGPASCNFVMVRRAVQRSPSEPQAWAVLSRQATGPRRTTRSNKATIRAAFTIEK